jgi:hypothetical protein
VASWSAGRKLRPSSASTSAVAGEASREKARRLRAGELPRDEAVTNASLSSASLAMMTTGRNGDFLRDGREKVVGAQSGGVFAVPAANLPFPASGHRHSPSIGSESRSPTSSEPSDRPVEVRTALWRRRKFCLTSVTSARPRSRDSPSTLGAVTGSGWLSSLPNVLRPLLRPRPPHLGPSSFAARNRAAQPQCRIRRHYSSRRGSPRRSGLPVPVPKRSLSTFPSNLGRPRAGGPSLVLSHRHVHGRRHRPVRRC